MASFGDLRSMIADRDWSRWYQIDLARLKDAPLAAAQEYVRPHIMAALWGVPIDERTGWIEIKKSGAAYVHVVTAEGVAAEGYLDDAGAQALSGSLFGYVGIHHIKHKGNYRRHGEQAQRSGVRIRAAALMLRGWPVTAKQIMTQFAKCPKQPGPERDAYDERWGVESWRFDSAEMSIGGQRVDLTVIDDPIRDAVEQMRAAQDHMVIGDDVLRALAHHIERHPPIGHVSMGTEPRLWRALYQVQPPDPKTEAIFGAQEPQRRSIIDGSPIPRDWRLDGDES